MAGQVDQVLMARHAADRHDEATAVGELLAQCRRYGRAAGGDEDRVERRGLGPASAAVAAAQFDVAVAQALQACTGGVAEVRMALDRVDPGGQQAQHCARIAGASADLEHAVGRADARAFGHQRDDVGLRDRLAGADRQRPIGVGVAPQGGGDELLARHAPHRVEHARVGDAARFELALDHAGAPMGLVEGRGIRIVWVHRGFLCRRASDTGAAPLLQYRSQRHGENLAMTPEFECARDLFLEGNVHFEAGRHAAAEASFQASLALVPGRASTLANLGAARLALGNLEGALNALDQALAVEPADLEAWSHKGVVLAALGRPAEALDCHDGVLERDPRRAANWLQRGLALGALGRHAEALAAHDRALGLEPNAAAAWFRRGQTLQFLERHGEALAAYDRALALDPELGDAWSNRGGILRDANRLDEAAQSYQRALDHGADAELNRYFLAAVTGRDAPRHAPCAYVGPLFNDYAPNFDRHLVETLHYRGHVALVEQLRRIDPARHYSVALDLGCGTGLCGPLVRPVAERLDGVDLSPGMLAQARALGVYDHLFEGDAAEHLRVAEVRYDLVLAADVFIYVGDLDPVFGAVRAAMTAGGMFGFTAEPAGVEEEEFRLLPSLRYAHSERYLRTVAARNGFDTLEVVAAPLREDQRVPVAGLYVYLSLRG